MRSDRLFAALAGALAACAPAVAQDGFVQHLVRPSVADPGVKQFDDPSIGFAKAGLPASAPLAIYLPGSNGHPGNRAFMAVIASQGYRVLNLMYDNSPSVAQVCPQDPDPLCSGKYRERRIFGTGPGAPGILNPPAEAIIPRLVAALRQLDRDAPGEGWGGYLDDRGQPRWDRILLSGLSQGAGMAAYIAQRYAVRRVVLFSSPWDFTGPDKRPAPWLDAGTGKTPADRWQAEYNKREATVPLIRQAYRALRIPAGNIRVFDLDLPPGVSADEGNPYHGITVRDTRYADQWRAMYGAAS